MSNDVGAVQQLLSDVQVFDVDGFTLLVKQQLKSSGSVSTLSDQLNSVISKADSQVDECVRNNYESFSKSVVEYQMLSTQVVDLKSQVESIKQTMSDSCVNVIELQDSLIQHAIVYDNIDGCIQKIKQIQQILQQVQNIYQLSTADKRYFYSALKQLNDLQDDLLDEDYSFILQIRDQFIPQTQNSIQKQVLKEFENWSQLVIELQPTVGQVAMNNTRRRGFDIGILSVGNADFIPPQSSLDSQQQDTISNKRSNLSLASAQRDGGGIGPSRSMKSMQSIEQILNAEPAVDPLNNQNVQVNCKPLYQCLHIHDVMDDRQSFKLKYSNLRSEQLQALIQSFSDKSIRSESDIPSFEQFINRVAGFFIIENHVVKSTNQFRTKDSIMQLWQTTIVNLKSIVTDALKSCQNTQHFMSVKEIIICFITILQGFKFDIGQMYSLIMTFFSVYRDLKCTECGKACQELIMSDAGDALMVESLSALERLQQVYQFEFQPEKYPCSVQFSSPFMGCCTQIRSFIQDVYQFGEGFYQDYEEINKVLVEGVIRLIGYQIVSANQTKLKQNNIQLTEIVRILINMDHLTLFVPQVWDILLQKSNESRKLAGKTTTLNADQQSSQFISQCNSKLSQVKQVAEERLFEVLHSKIDSFVELNDYDFAGERSKVNSPVRSKNVSPVGQHQSHMEPSQFLTDLVSFLETMWSATLIELPDTIKSFMYYDAINRIGEKMLELLLNPNIKKLSMQFVDGQMSVDIQFLYKFLLNLKDEKLLDPFQELLQSVSLLQISSNLEHFIDSKSRRKYYGRVSARNALSLLVKYRDGSQWQVETSSGNGASSFFKFTTSPTSPPSAKSGSTQSSTITSPSDSGVASPTAASKESEGDRILSRKKALDAVIKHLKEEVKKNIS
ncbi:hypothetical protein MIR68_000183 [Amoeboaphelidium protococcarum]|nr:hypothetical protein MIR68_000183 [Amoeboaphelidium protococcarum]